MVSRMDLTYSEFGCIFDTKKLLRRLYTLLCHLDFLNLVILS